MLKSESYYTQLSQGINVEGNNPSANSQIGSEVRTYFLNEYVNYRRIDFYCVGKWRTCKEPSARAPADTLH